MKRAFSIYISGIFLVIVIAGCGAYLRSAEHKNEQYLHSHALFNEGRYAEAAAGFLNFVEQYPDDELADDAQYFLAYTLIYHANKDKDYGKALAQFKILLVKYPKSYWIKDAKNWVSQIEEILSLKNEVAGQKAENEKLKKDIKNLMKTDIEMEKKRKKMK
ncbi:MAG: outer membrane protein assembly factor BamD [Nitrospirae bacterium]|nr:outer membrane protein assembly factor BamD [Nitrospirota bacterium]